MDINGLFVKIKLAMYVLCTASSGYVFSSDSERECAFSKQDLLCQEEVKSRLENSKVYILVSMYDKQEFLENLVKTLAISMKELSDNNVKSHLLITCDGRQEDKNACDAVFANFPFAENTEIKLQKENVKLSKTRWNQLEDTLTLMQKDYGERPDLNQYVFIFDADDIMHKDLILLELLAQLKTNARAVGPGTVLKCTLEDSSGILTNYASKDVGDFFCYRDRFDEFAYTLFTRESVLALLYQKESGHNLATLEPFEPIVESIPNGFVRVMLKKEEDINLKSANNFNEMQDDINKLALFYYMQSSESMESSMLKELSENYLNCIEDNAQDVVDYPDSFLAILGMADGVSEKYQVTNTSNSNIDMKFLLDKWKYAHVFAYKLKQLVDVRLSETQKMIEETKQKADEERKKMCELDKKMYNTKLRQKLIEYKKDINIIKEQIKQQENNNERSLQEELKTSVNEMTEVDDSLFCEEYRKVDNDLEYAKTQIEQLRSFDKEKQKEMLDTISNKMVKLGEKRIAIINKYGFVAYYQALDNFDKANKVLEKLNFAAKEQQKICVWLNGNGKALLEQPMDKPLSREFMKKFYQPVFERIFAQAK